MPAGKDRVTGCVHRLVKGCGVWLDNTTLLPPGLTPNDAFSNIGFRFENTPARAIMKYLMEISGAKARYDEFAIVITPL